MARPPLAYLRRLLASGGTGARRGGTWDVDTGACECSKGPITCGSCIGSPGPAGRLPEDQSSCVPNQYGSWIIVCLPPSRGYTTAWWSPPKGGSRAQVPQVTNTSLTLRPSPLNDSRVSTQARKISSNTSTS